MILCFIALFPNFDYVTLLMESFLKRYLVRFVKLSNQVAPRRSFVVV